MLNHCNGSMCRQLGHNFVQVLASARLLMCETETAQRSSGLNNWTAQSARSIRKGSWVELQRAMDLGCWFTTQVLHTRPHPQWLYTCFSPAVFQLKTTTCVAILSSTSSSKDCSSRIKNKLMVIKFRNGYAKCSLVGHLANQTSWLALCTVCGNEVLGLQIISFWN